MAHFYDIVAQIDAAKGKFDASRRSDRWTDPEKCWTASVELECNGATLRADGFGTDLYSAVEAAWGKIEPLTSQGPAKAFRGPVLEHKPEVEGKVEIDDSIPY